MENWKSRVLLKYFGISGPGSFFGGPARVPGSGVTPIDVQGCRSNFSRMPIKTQSKKKVVFVIFNFLQETKNSNLLAKY